MMEFFRDLLFDSPGAYTLFGTKPISTSCIYELLSEEQAKEEKAQWQAYYESLSEEEKAKLVLRKQRYDFSANYRKWQEIKHRFPIHQYLFGVFPSPIREDVDVILFVNIEMTLKILLKYYDDFRRILGFDFDPFQVVFEVENKESLFWQRVMHSHTLQGILLGFGRDNAWFFEWGMKYRNDPGKRGDFIRSIPSTRYEDRDIKYPDPQHFMLPVFGSYGLYPTDKQLLEQYKKEQKQIKALYRGRDEVDVALEWLTRCAPQAHK